MNFIRKTIKVGNSAGVLLPKKLLGSEVKITVISNPKDIKKTVMRAIESDLRDILGVYLTSKSPTEVIVLTGDTKKILEKENMKIVFVPLGIFRMDLKDKPKLREKMLKAEAILNNSLLDKIKENKL